MKKIYLVNINTFENFKNKNKSENLHRFASIHTPKSLPKGLKINEIFDKEVELPIPTTYDSIIPNELNHQYNFTSKNGNKYRIDFVKFTENDIDEKIKLKLTKIEEENKKGTNSKFYYEYVHDNRLLSKKIVSISFSTIESNDLTYDDLTERKEEFDILENVVGTIKSFVKQNPNYIYMFGDPKSDKKYRIYHYIGLKCFPDYEIICDYSNLFPDTKIGYYFK
jgi:hypothetical protein